MSMPDNLVTSILGVFVANNYIPSSTAHIKLAYDINQLGWQKAKVLASTMSPSQLGRMGYLGIRRLAQLRRDNPEKFSKVINDLDRVMRRERE